MPTEEPTPPPTSEPTVPSTSRPDEDEADERAEAYKSGYKDGYRVGYRTGKQAYWVSLLLCLWKHRKEGDKPKAEGILAGLRCLLRIERMRGADLTRIVSQARESFDKEEIEKLIQEVEAESKADPAAAS